MGASSLVPILLPLLFNQITAFIPLHRHVRSSQCFIRHANNNPTSSEMDRILSLTDPFDILSLSPTSDSREIKRAYRRMAMKYHPDVVEGDKKVAGQVFSKINEAYQSLSSGSGSGSGSQSGRTEYTPPHRRRSTGRTSSAGFEWDDYLKDKGEEYNTNGDSFGAIFSDLIGGIGAASASGGSSGVLKDLVEFLERNVDGFDTGYDSDPSLELLLHSGTKEELRAEVEDTELLVEQLSRKKENVQREMMELENDEGVSPVKRLERDEMREELKARNKILDGYLSKAKTRLDRLRMRYREVRGASRTTTTTETDSNYTSRSTYQEQQYTSQQSQTSQSRQTSSDEKTWNTRQGFGSTGRGRSRRNRSQTTGNTSYSPPPPPTTTPSPQSSVRSNTASSRGTSSVTASDWVPPHRRTKSATERVIEDKKRLRELKVEDEFEQLKRELGL